MNDPIFPRDQLVLLLIAKSGINDIFQLVMKFDRCDFPGEVILNLFGNIKNKKTSQIDRVLSCVEAMTSLK